MKIAGIIAEYDPLHTGHAWQIQQAKAMGAQGIVCVMSPDVVQRGGFSILPIGVRVQAALLAGADLVIELPAPYAASSAEQFGKGAVHLLASLGIVDSLVFGSESGQAAPLMEVAELLLSKEFSENIVKEQKKGDSFPVARMRVMEQMAPQYLPLLDRPNDILGIEYCKAILQQNVPICPVAIERQGAGHGGKPQGGFSSASWLRKQTALQGVEGWKEYTPASCVELYQQAEKQGLLLDTKAANIALLSRLRNMDIVQIQNIRGIREGLEYRLQKGIRQATTLEQLYQAMKCKRYPHARLRRLVLDAALQVPAQLPSLPPYLHLLGASQKGLELWKQAKPEIPAGTSLAKLEKSSPQGAKIAAIHTNAQDLAALCRQIPQPMGLSYTTPLLIKEKLCYKNTPAIKAGEGLSCNPPCSKVEIGGKGQP